MAWQIQLGKQVHAALMYFSFCVQYCMRTNNMNNCKNHKNTLKTILYFYIYTTYSSWLELRIEMSTRLKNAHA